MSNSEEQSDSEDSRGIGLAQCSNETELEKYS